MTIDRFGPGAEPCVCSRAPAPEECNHDCRCLCWHLTEHRLASVRGALEEVLIEDWMSPFTTDEQENAAFFASLFGVATGLMIAMEHPEVVPLLVASHRAWYHESLDNEGRSSDSPAEIAIEQWSRRA